VRIAAQAVADLRSAAGRYPRDPAMATLVRDLWDGSEDFRRLWDVADAGR
jgi:hypothetical protein